MAEGHIRSVRARCAVNDIGDHTGRDLRYNQRPVPRRGGRTGSRGSLTMKRVKGRYDGSTVVLEERVDLPADTEVDVLTPLRRERSLTALLDELDLMPVGETMSLDEIVALVHEVRAPSQGEDEE